MAYLLSSATIGDARVFDAPHFFREVFGVGQQSGLRVNLPVIHAIGGAGHTKVGMAAPIFHAAQQQGRAVRQQGGAGVEHAIDRIGPIGGGQDGIELVTAKEFGVLIAH